ncbi:MAG: hypothetical protein AABW47_00525 [Nanoarchaeota archaeon]
MQNKGDETQNVFQSDFFSMKSHRGQVTIFIIIAILIVAGVAGVLLLKPNLFAPQIPVSIQPVYKTFLSCIEDKALTGIDLLESQAGYIELPVAELGSPYIPFSSQLNFLGNPIPYWYYVSGNNIQKEQIPSKIEMGASLGKFIEEKIRECNFNSYYQEGFEIMQDEPTAVVSIGNDNVLVNLNMNMQINKGTDSVSVKNHEVAVKSNLGMLYDSAKSVYEKEQKEMFLENYGIDTLRLYAPVDGVELTCSPKIWNTYDIFTSLQDAIEMNTLALNTQTPSTKDGKYFSVSGINADVRFINSKSWPTSFEVLPSDNSILIANPVGNQQGLGIIGFCYVPYHFVYNVNYPVLVQAYKGNEVFQFPIAVVIKGNKPRIALDSSASKETTLELCPYKNTPTTVTVRDTNSNPLDADVSYECFGESCYIGKTSSGTLTEDFPQCVNGFVTTKASGFVNSRQQYSTTSSGSIDIAMQKLYNKNIKLKLGGADYNGKALIYFVSESNSQIVSYPEQNKVNLSEGDYGISVYVYKDSSIRLTESVSEECVDVPSAGIGGIFGFKDKNCFDVKVPSQIISNVLSGGGKVDYSISEDNLKNSNSIEINSDDLGVPTTMEQLQNNYLLFDNNELEVNFK